MILLVMSSWDNVIAVQNLVVKLPLNAARYCSSYVINAILYGYGGICGTLL